MNTLAIPAGFRTWGLQWSHPPLRMRPPEGDGIEAKGQAGFRENVRTTDNVLSRSL